LRFKLSYRDLAELARELGVCVAPSTILRWVIRYAPVPDTQLLTISL
jgi:transposase, IS6 family